MSTYNLSVLFLASMMPVGAAVGIAAGAAVLAAVGVGIYSDYASAAENMVKVSKRDIPISDNVEFYNDKGHYTLSLSENQIRRATKTN